MPLADEEDPWAYEKSINLQEHKGITTRVLSLSTLGTIGLLFAT